MIGWHQVRSGLFHLYKETGNRGPVGEPDGLTPSHLSAGLTPSQVRSGLIFTIRT